MVTTENADETAVAGPLSSTTRHAPSLDTTSTQSPDIPWLSAEEETAWRGVAAMIVQLPGALDSQLQRDSGLGLFEYLVLSSLSMNERRMMRMSALAEVVNGSLSRLSNVVKRLEQRDWVRREPDPTDGRYTVAILTDTGWDTVVAAAPGHVQAVRHFVLSPLTRGQLRQLGEVGSRVREQLHDCPLPTTETSMSPCGEPEPC